MNPVAWVMDKFVSPFSLAEKKDIVPWSEATRVGFHDRDNFTTNRVTLSDYNDNSSHGEAAVLGLSAAWACVNLITGTIASLPLMVYRRPTGSKERLVAHDHPLYRLLHDSPNADQTSMDFWEFITACIELRGNGYSEVDRRSDQSVVALGVPIPPQKVEPKRKSNGAIEYKVTEDGRERIVPQERMLHIRGFGGSPLGGLSTLSFGRQAFGMALSIEGAASRTFRNGMRSTGAFVSDRPLNGEQMEEAETVIREKYVGAMNAGRPLLLNNGMKYQQISVTPEDSQMLQSRGFGVEEICRFFGVPPFMIGHTEKSTSWGTGLEQQTLGFQKFTLRRRLKRIEQALEKQLLTSADKVAGISIEFNLEGLLRADSAARSKFYGEMSRIGAMTINEIRALENLPPVEGGDVPRMQAQNIPITEAEGLNGDEAGPPSQALEPKEAPPIHITVPVSVHMPKKTGVEHTTVTKHDKNGRVSEFVRREIEEE